MDRNHLIRLNQTNRHSNQLQRNSFHTSLLKRKQLIVIYKILQTQRAVSSQEIKREQMVNKVAKEIVSL